ncbi:MAG: hypothetical protein SFU27_06565 [Thermonemataceae bacterium]|nr:hypothetical protein [Thermonemataceae bacterium]
MIDYIRQELKRFSGQEVFQIAIVSEVDKEKATCKAYLLENEEILLENIRLQAIDDEQNNGALVFPKAESSVLIGKIDNISGYFVVMFSEIEEIAWKINNKQRLKITEEEIVFADTQERFKITEEEIVFADTQERLKITNNEIVFNGGNKGALVELAKLKAKLNNIENAINSLMSHYKSHNHLHPQGSTTGFVAPYYGLSLALTNDNDLANSQIKQ